MSPLDGKVIGITAERRADQQRRYLEARGARVIHAPVLKTIDHTERPELVTVADSMIDHPPDILVVQTGQGLRWWLAGLGDERSASLVSALSTTEVWCRGVKATSACRSVGLEVSWQAPTETTEEVLVRLGSEAAAGRHVAVQLDGNANDWRGRATPSARITEIDVYSYRLPDDTAPAVELIDAVIAGRVSAVTFTASPAIRHLREIAAAAATVDALDLAFRTSCVAAVVGPVCAATAAEAGWTNVVEPVTARLIPMLDALEAVNSR